MDLLSLILLLFSAFLHAAWHGSVKGSPDRLAQMAGISIVATIVAALAIPLCTVPTPTGWLLIVASALLHNLYKGSLLAAYRYGDLAQAFPFVRGTVPLFSGLLAYVVLQQVPSPPQILGAAVISAGLITLASPTWRPPHNWALLLTAAMAGSSVAAYAVLDAYILRVMGDWLSFTVWLIVVDCLLFLIIAGCLRGSSLWTSLRNQRSSILGSGVISVISFAIFLWALGRAHVGMVSAVRETSILFALALGTLRYREELTASRVIGAALISSGIATIALTAAR